LRRKIESATAPRCGRKQKRHGGALRGKTKARTLAQKKNQELGRRRRTLMRERKIGSGGALAGENTGAANPSALKPNRNWAGPNARVERQKTKPIHRQKMEMMPDWVRSRTKTQNRKMESSDPKRKDQEKRPTQIFQ
jgi:hypothetical protein